MASAGATSTLFIIAVVLLVIALYSHYTVYAYMYQLPSWTNIVGIVVALLVIVGAVVYVFASK